MGDIHLLGSNLHVLWLCLTYTVRFESIVLFIHILSTHNLLFLNIFLTPPPFVSNGQHSTYPPSPPRQQWSAFGLPPLPPSSAMVSICHTPSPPSGGWRNMWTAPYCVNIYPYSSVGGRNRFLMSIFCRKLCILKHLRCFVAIYAYFCVKLLPQKFWSCNFFDKYHVWLSYLL